MKNKKILIIFVIAILLCLLGTTYAFFNYYKEGSNQEVIAGKVMLEFNEDVDTISLTNVFPETTEEARKRDDNFVTFTISGTNTTKNKDIFYQIMLNEGEDETGKKRFKPNELVFDLVEIDENNNETYLVDAMYFNNIDAQRIWVDIVEREETTGINKTYKLRMWINDDVLVSDSYPNADYTTEEFANSYASVKVSVQGDFKEKASPYNYMMARIGQLDFENGIFEHLWPTEISELYPYITEIRFMSMEKEMLDMLVAEGAFDLTDTTKSPAGSVIALPMDTGVENEMSLWIMSDGITMLPSNSNGMFFNLEYLKSIYFNNISTKDVTNMSYMFYNCKKLETLNLNSFNSRKVENMAYMFCLNESLTSLNLNTFNTSKVVNMQNMFNGCSTLKSVDISRFDTSNVTNMRQMFGGCDALMELDLSNFNTSNVTSMYLMFNGVNLDELDLSNFDISEDTDIGGVFTAVEINKINLSGWRFTDDNIGAIKQLYASIEIDLSECDVSNVTDMSYLFEDFENLITIDLSGWDTSNVKWMNYMFYGCSSLVSLDISAWDTSNVKQMNHMFYGCSSLTSLDISTLDTGSLRAINYMFYGCSSLTSLDLSNWNTSAVHNMSSMFEGCTGLTNLDISTWNTSGVTAMSNMFFYCSSLTSLDLSNWDTSNVTNISQMFRECTGLTSLDISNFTFDSVTSSGYVFKDMQVRTDNTPTIIVKDATAQNWILALTSTNRPESWTTDNVIIG